MTATEALRRILDAVGRVVQEAKHHAAGRERPLDARPHASLPPGLVGPLAELEATTEPEVTAALVEALSTTAPARDEERRLLLEELLGACLARYAVGVCVRTAVGDEAFDTLVLFHNVFRKACAAEDEVLKRIIAHDAAQAAGRIG